MTSGIIQTISVTENIETTRVANLNAIKQLHTRESSQMLILVSSCQASAECRIPPSLDALILACHTTKLLPQLTAVNYKPSICKNNFPYPDKKRSRVKEKFVQRKDQWV